MEDFYIYVHIKKKDGQPFYIGKGKGIRAMSKQFRNKFWHNIVNKYGYEIVMLEENLSEVKAYELEIYWINRIGRRDLKCGPLVNMSNGGEGEAGRVFTEEHKRNMSISHTGKIVSDETRKKISIAGIGRKLSEAHKKILRDTPKMLGKHHTEESKQKMRIANTGRILTEEHKAKIPGRAKDMFAVVQLTKNNEVVKIWDSHHDAAKAVNSDRPERILSVCNGILKTHKQFIWKFIE